MDRQVVLPKSRVAGPKMPAVLRQLVSGNSFLGSLLAALSVRDAAGCRQPGCFSALPLLSAAIDPELLQSRGRGLFCFCRPRDPGLHSESSQNLDIF